MTRAIREFVNQNFVGVLVLCAGLVAAGAVAGFMIDVNADDIARVEAATKESVGDLDTRVDVLETSIDEHATHHMVAGAKIYTVLGQIPGMKKELEAIANKQDTVMSTVAGMAATMKQIEKHLDKMNSGSLR